MTYGVPYSFVPGTKAKADEVNANFIDVLNKIEDTNTKITTINEQFSQRFEDEVESLSSQIADCEASKLDLSLSNLDTQGKSIIDAKADASLLDGKWTTKTIQLCNEKVIAAGETQTLSLESCFPDTTNLYMFILDGYFQVGSSAFIYMSTDKSGSICALRTTIKYGDINVVAVSGSKREITVLSQPSSSGTNKYTLAIRGYRKIR